MDVFTVISLNVAAAIHKTANVGQVILLASLRRHICGQGLLGLRVGSS